MIGCLRTSVRNQPIIALYFESENELKFYNLKASTIKAVDKVSGSRTQHSDSAGGEFYPLIPSLMLIQTVDPLCSARIFE